MHPVRVGAVLLRREVWLYRGSLAVVVMLAAAITRDPVSVLVALGFGWQPPTYWLTRESGRVRVVVPTFVPSQGLRQPFVFACLLQLGLTALLSWALAAGFELVTFYAPSAGPALRAACIAVAAVFVLPIERLLRPRSR
jgi:hypothetical protein